MGLDGSAVPTDFYREGLTLAKTLAYNATLVGREDLTPTLSIFRVEPDEDLPGTGPWFVPGQYMVIGLNNEEQPELAGVLRPMSIASAPEDRDVVEFYIRYVNHPTSDNPLTHLLWKAKAGDRMFMRPKPAGKFTLLDTVGSDDPRLLVFVSAGTGLAPFVSIVRSFHNREPEASLSRFAVLHGVSYPDDLGYREELTALQESHGLRYVPTVSRPGEASDWSGATGRVETLFAPDQLPELEARLGLDSGDLRPQGAAVFVCGLQGTIGKTIEHLAGRGFVPDHKRIRTALGIDDEAADSLFFEQYDTEPVIDLNDADLLERLRADVQGAR